MHLRPPLFAALAALTSGCVVRGVLDAERDTADLPDDTSGEDTSGEDTSGQDTSDTAGDSGTRPIDGLVIELTWAHPGDDLDLHLLAPGGVVETETDCYFANCIDWGDGVQVDWGVVGDDSDEPRLSLDDIPGTGPEQIVFSKPGPGTYTVIVVDYPGSVYAEPNPFTISCWFDGVLVGTFTGTTVAEEQHVTVATVTFPGAVVAAAPAR